MIWCAVVGLFRSRVALQAEILVLRHQLDVLRRKSPRRVALGNIDRVVVLFDIGHGKGSFALRRPVRYVGQRLRSGYSSSDVHALCNHGPAFDQVTTMSKFLCLGMPLVNVIAASTANAAFALRRAELGSLKPGRFPRVGWAFARIPHREVITLSLKPPAPPCPLSPFSSRFNFLRFYTA